MRKAAPGVAVVATNRLAAKAGEYLRHLLSLWLCIALFSSLPATAAVLPEDRVDIMYHGYEGGGMKIDGPSVLIRKKVRDDVSVRANYYVDMVTSASIDVVTTASEYTEERTEYSLGADYLNDRTTISSGFTRSEESDYLAKTGYISISQGFFGDMTNITLGYSHGQDEVRRTGDPNFKEEVRRQNYRVSVAQVITKSWTMDFAAELITDEGFLNNPYRRVRFLEDDAESCDINEDHCNYDYDVPSEPGEEPVQKAGEIYPETRTSAAFAIRSSYYLDYRASLHFEYRYFDDSWGIIGHSAKVGYVHPYSDHWTFETSARYHTQNDAEFYFDVLEFENQFNFFARDKELSTFDSVSLGLGITFEYPLDQWEFFDRFSVNLFYDYFQFDYENFRDAREAGVRADEQSPYSFNAGVTRFFLSFFF